MIRKYFSPLAEFLESESAGGIILMFSAALALVVANSPLANAYGEVLHIEILGLSLLHWINDGLMAVFFLLVGLEIKREFLGGELSTWPQRALPAIAALGGMAVPALIYVWLNAGPDGALTGWAIPAATDIAFALGILSLLGPRVPASLKIFLAALAILDDLGAIIIIALFYTAEIHLWALGGAGAVLVMLVMLNRLGVSRLAAYLPLGAVLWFFMHESGVHATLSGVILALAIPAGEGEHTPLLRLEHALARPVAFLIVPVFGFANAGIALGGIGLAELMQPVTLGIAAGLFLGKQAGVFGATRLAAALGLVSQPHGASWLQVYGVSVLCGVGFTMSLFIGLLAFPGEGVMDAAVKLGVLAGSAASALAGAAILMIAGRKA